MQKFINRTKELETLEKQYISNLLTKFKAKAIVF